MIMTVTMETVHVYVKELASGYCIWDERLNSSTWGWAELSVQILRLRHDLFLTPAFNAALDEGFPNIACI